LINKEVDKVYRSLVSGFEKSNHAD
jgi:hypothetical protein